MSLFTVKQVGFDGTLVVGAAHAVAADGWWVFQDADGRPLAALPVVEVDAIESIPEDDARGGAWRHAPVPAVRKTKPRKERPSAPRRRLWSGVLASLNPARAHLRQTTGRRIPSRSDFAVLARRSMARASAAARMAWTRSTVSRSA